MPSDTNEDKLDIPKSENVESVTKLESKKDDSEGKIPQTGCTKDELIDKISEQVNKRHVLMKTVTNCLQKLAVNILRSPQKDYFLMLNISEKTHDQALRKLLETIIAKEEEAHRITYNNLAKIKLLQEEIILKKELLKELQASFKEMKEKAALNSVHSETGEHFSAKDVKELLRKEGEVSELLQEYQLQSIQKRHGLNLALGKKKNLAEGPLDFSEYEMMCIETQNNKEIIQPILEKKCETIFLIYEKKDSTLRVLMAIQKYHKLRIDEIGKLYILPSWL